MGVYDFFSLFDDLINLMAFIADLSKTDLYTRHINPFSPRVNHGDISLDLTFESADKSYDVTIQMKPLQQYFCMVPFVFNVLQNEI